MDDVMLLVQNEIANTKLQPISLTYAPDDYLGYTLTPHINIKSEKWDGGHTYITITFYDLYTDQSVAVVKSSGIGLSISQDQKLALGVFTVVGISTAYAAVPESGKFLLIFVGVITGVGGGVMRDVMAGNMPYIFVKHIYACASLAGAFICAYGWEAMGMRNAMVAGMLLVVVIRFLAAYYRWNLPKVAA